MQVKIHSPFHFSLLGIAACQNGKQCFNLCPSLVEHKVQFTPAIMYLALFRKFYSGPLSFLWFSLFLTGNVGIVLYSRSHTLHSTSSNHYISFDKKLFKLLTNFSSLYKNGCLYAEEC
jgi:hypothetical protein